LASQSDWPLLNPVRFILRAPRIPTIQPDPHSDSPEGRIILLNIKEEDPLRQSFQSFIEQTGLETTTGEVELNYDYFSAEQVLRVLLPEDMPEGTPTSFTGTGHIGELLLFF
jgi:tRNA (guanine37-N1)-methyltransferase